MQILRTYYRLTKPGIIYGNTFAAAGGFLLAAKSHIDFVALAAALLGTALIIACGCVCNNYIDRELDKKMTRTNKRALVRGVITNRSALVYATCLGILGFIVLGVGTNWLTIALGALGLFFYVVVYGIAKRKTVFGTIIGSISGALPPVAGYTAAANHLDLGTFLLFLILVCWQMPHFYAIAMYRYDDYKAAGLPVLPVVKGMRTAKLNVLGFIAAFIIATILLTVYGYTGYIYLAIVLGLGLTWLGKGIKHFNNPDNTIWGRKMFLFSLIIITTLPVLWSIDTYLP